MERLNIQKFDKSELKDLIKPEHLAVVGDLSSPNSQKLSLEVLKVSNTDLCTPLPSSKGSLGDSPNEEDFFRKFYQKTHFLNNHKEFFDSLSNSPKSIQDPKHQRTRIPSLETDLKEVKTTPIIEE